MLQEHLKSINPQDIKLVYGVKYSLYRGDEYLGVGTWTKDDNIGDSFQQVKPNGVISVIIPDRWEIIN